MKTKKTDAKDGPLTRGAGFWVNEDDADTFIEGMKSAPEVKEVSCGTPRALFVS